MEYLDESFEKIERLLHAVWPAVKEIDWSKYCTKNFEPPPGEPAWYTGLVLHATNAQGWKRTCSVGSVPNLDSAMHALRLKDHSMRKYPDVQSSLEMREVAADIWAGGLKSTVHPGLNLMITELPDVGDHTLLVPMSVKCNLLDLQSAARLVDYRRSQMSRACDYLGMDFDKYQRLTARMNRIVHNT